jgi:Transposase
MCRVLESVMEVNSNGLGTPRKAHRKSWTPAQKRQIVEESYAAGANMAEVAQRHEVRPALLASWRRQQARMASSSKPAAKFAAVRVSPAPTDGVIEIDLAGGCVRVRGIVDAGMLREVLAAAR